MKTFKIASVFVIVCGILSWHDMAVISHQPDEDQGELMNLNHSIIPCKIQLGRGCQQISIYKCHIDMHFKETTDITILFASTPEHTNRPKNGYIPETDNCHVQPQEKDKKSEMEALCNSIRCILNQISTDPNSRVVQEWKNCQHDISNNCNLTHCLYSYQEDTQKINVKEVHTKEQAVLQQDCTNVVNPINLAEMTNSKNYDEKRDQSALTIVTEGQANRMLAVYIPFNQIPILVQTWLNIQKKCQQPEAMYKGSSNSERVKNLQDTSPFKEVHLPYISRLLIERKRHNIASSWKPWKKVKRNTSKYDNAPASTNIRHRHKREMHIMMARYRQEIKGSRKTKPKTSAPRSSNNGDKSVPYSILNVSFTGSWEPPPTSTVKPRVGRPLKMTPDDMEFVHGKKNDNKNKQNKGLEIIVETK